MGSAIVGAIVAFGILFVFQLVLVGKAKQRASNKADVRLMDLIVTSEDGCYSISRLQMYLWTFAAVMGYGAVFMFNYSFTVPDIPESLFMLLGVNMAATVASTAINTVRTQDKKVQKGNPDFWNDIFFESPGSLDLPRTQMFVWTIISLGVFFFLLYKSLAQNDLSLPDIPTGLVALMGISQGAYLGGKAAAKKE